MSDYYWNEYKNVLLDEAYLIDTLKYQQRVVNKQVEENTSYNKKNRECKYWLLFF